MKCIIPGSNARIFAKAIQSLAKVGSELFFEADDNGLSLRTVNSTRSAFAVIKFYPNFFTDFEVGSNSDDEFESKCKVSMKACMGTLKNMKQVELCEVSIDSVHSKLVIKLKCRLDTNKTHSISILDLESLQAVYMTETAPNKLSAPYKLFAEISSNFQMNEEEITLEAGSSDLIVKNYVEGSHVDRRFMRSQLSLKADEFDKYLIGEETSVTFCLREFRAFLGFAEAINLDLNLNFETAGRPIVFVMKDLQIFEANLVMSTLSPDDVTTCDNSVLNTSKNTSSVINRKRSTDDHQTKAAKKTRQSTEQEDESMDDNELFNFPNRNSIIESVDPLRGDISTTVDTPISLPAGNTQNKSISRPLIEKNTESEGICVTFRDTEELNKDCVPKSPQSERRKRTRQVFKRCFEATFNPRLAPGSSQILARSSDTED